MSSLSEDCGRQTSVVIGGLPINIQSADSEFIAMLERRYAGFLATARSRRHPARRRGGRRDG